MRNIYVLCLLVPCASPPSTRAPFYTRIKASEQQESSNNLPALVGRPTRPGDRTALSDRALTELPCRAALIALHNKSKHALQLICIAFSYIISADLRSTHFTLLRLTWRRTHARSQSHHACQCALQSYSTPCAPPPPPRSMRYHFLFEQKLMDEYDRRPSMNHLTG